MKPIIALALVTVCVLALCQDAYASPSDMDKAKDTKAKDGTATVKDAKAQKDAKKKCAKQCPARDPICAHDPTNPTLKPKTFDTTCHMEIENCEMGTKYALKNKGQCV
ncbi:uncharacterized protein LOC107036453 [Diachasma alloeum]|uniref:uncharacterized protein LOC107036453 n=1 Tax=Diachasma alloeum TaxID=454923 RepID=UPI00073831E3|nr:uncharacterized protein LOC107036453 [Diachasma alloeum]